MIVANKDMEPEISCVNSASGKSEGYGPLEGGYMFKCSTGLARQCMAPECPVLNELGAAIPFEIAVGINGRIWVNSGAVDHSILLTNAIVNSEYMPENQVRVMVSELLERIKSR
jgi:exosome complex component RRP40